MLSARRTWFVPQTSSSQSHASQTRQDILCFNHRSRILTQHGNEHARYTWSFHPTNNNWSAYTIHSGFVNEQFDRSYSSFICRKLKKDSLNATPYFYFVNITSEFYLSFMYVSALCRSTALGRRSKRCNRSACGALVGPIKSHEIWQSFLLCWQISVDPNILQSIRERWLGALGSTPFCRYACEGTERR